MTRYFRRTTRAQPGTRRRSALRLRAVTCGALAVLVGACTDVTTEPKSSVSSGNVFNDPAAYRSGVAKLYGTLALAGPGDADAGSSDIQGIDSGFGQYLRAWWNLQELPTDEATLAWNDASAGVQDLNSQTWNGSNGTVTAMYARILLQATLASEYLRQTTDAKLAERNVTTALRADITRYRAEARFLRALSYWHAIDLFARVPLVTEESPIGAGAPPQATRQQLFDFVAEELHEARADLPAANRADASQYGRATQAAVDMLLAKLYLNAAVYTGTPRFDSVLVATERVITPNAFQLDGRYQNLFLADNHTSPEIIFAVPADGARTRTYGGATYIAHAEFGDNVGGVEAGADLGLNGGWYGLRARREFADLFTGLTGDQRGAIRTGDPAIVFAEGQSPTLTKQVDNFGEGYRIHKFRNVTKAGVGGSDRNFVDIDFPMFRLADAYLMYAEAVTRGAGGTRSTALGYVNALRTRASSPMISDAELTTTFLLDERGRELFWEAHRRTDLIRYDVFTGSGKLWQFKGGVAAGTATDAKFNLFPIPDVERAANPSLAQNPGY
jgi:starch-binding outer membrane protein, SusD/RagB family